MAGGFVLLAAHLRRERRREGLFITVWAAFILILTIFHSTFEYYLAVPLILLSSFCIVGTLRYGSGELKARVPKRIKEVFTRSPSGETNQDTRTPRKQSAGKKKKTQNPKRSGKDGTGDHQSSIPAILAAIVLVLVPCGAFISLVQEVQYGTRISSQEINGDWMESLTWMEGHTPSPQVDYFGTYDQKNFSYPPGSYGVMAVWDAGHWITFFSQRIPNVNPFQDNLAGNDGGAAFFLTPSEEQAGTILTNLGTRYVITDAWSTLKLTDQIPWVDPSDNSTPYVREFLYPDPDNPKQFSLVSLYDNAYYQSMMVRLQIFDGSMALPTLVKYLEYTDREVPGAGETAPISGIASVLTRVDDLNATAAEQEAASVNANSPQGHHAAVLSDMPYLPVAMVPALSHFRLIHESPSNVTWDQDSGNSSPEEIKNIKVFEFVRGAHIRGNGIIEIPLVTNTGRRFTYTQESVDGEFIVPYSTRGIPSR